ncbi:MAG: hypothetical protein DSY85_17525 [Marinomonas sp.]|nr:MAG: hypothetical protein DSY85_17525 [Marinomonas sp.]
MSGEVGPRFPRDVVWGCDAVPSQSEVVQRQNVGPRFPRDLVWGCDAVPSQSEVVQRQNVGPRFPRDLVWDCDAAPSRSEVLQELDFAGFGLGMQCCSLAKRGPTGLGFRGIWFGNAMLFPRAARCSGLIKPDTI